MSSSVARRGALVLLACLLGMVAVSTGRGVAAPTAITSAGATASVVGVVTRIPAEMPGGAVYASTSVNLDKARARASGFYPGYLADAFLRSSAEEYGEIYDEAEAVAENPAQTAPEHEEVEGGQEHEGARAGLFRAEAPEPTEAQALSTAAGGADSVSELLSFASGTARSVSRVEADGTVVTDALATLTSVRLAEVVVIGAIESRATVTTPVGGEPELELATNVKNVSVAGVPATLDQDGLSVDGSAVVSQAEVQRFNETVEALAEHGITLEAVPTETEAQPGSGSLDGAALRFRYEAKKNPTVRDVLDQNPAYQVVPLPEELGYDEEFLLTQVSASAQSRPRGELDVDLGFGGGIDDGLPAGDDLGSIEEPTSPEEPTGPSVAAPEDVGQAATPEDVGQTPAPEVADPDSQPTPPGGSNGDDVFELSVEASASPVDHFAGFSRLLLLLAFAGAVAPRVLRGAATT